MATLVLAAVGAAAGSAVGGSVLGLTGAVIGRAVGATLGRVIDQAILGRGSAPVETGRVERFRLMGAGEGAAIPQVWGRVRIGGQVIWASRFAETRTERGGKGSPGPASVDYSYTVSLAVALCRGPVLRVGRIWADGQEVAPGDLNLRIYPGTEDQLPDPKIAAVEGADFAPAYRGIAYVVVEDLPLGRFGNRVPQLSFEVIRAVPGGMQDVVRAVALMPGTGEYALATTRVHVASAPGVARAVNVNTPEARADAEVALDQLTGELPQTGAVSLIVSWFGDDLRAGQCRVRPKVERQGEEGVPQPWRAGGIGRGQAQELATAGGRPIYGGTPSDASVIEAIAAARDRGLAVMFYPFLLMEQRAGNGLPDPWGGAEQPVLPWRGRITCSVAPGRPGSPDRTAAADAEVAAFLGAAQPGDFSVVDGQVTYAGPQGDWGWRRMILHYAHLCAAAGGVDAFCVGSEFRGLTQVRGAGDGFPFVAGLRQLAAEVRAILGPACRISYAADWSEYFGYLTPEGDRLFHLDPFWADPNVDFVGIDNYMPLSDWREGEDHADLALARSVHDLGYLAGNVAGGEGFDWFYRTEDARAAQVRTPITDDLGEPWIWRYKDLRGWWENAHHDRVGGLRAPVASPWVPRSKPIWFTEYGCPAIDKGTNQPNVFLDPKSSESFAPRFSTGRRDDAIQLQYLRAVDRHWSDPARNPVSDLYGGPMVDMTRAFVWAWDMRPFPAFPGKADLWADAANWARGHWISGRAGAQPLASVVAEICAEAGVAADVGGLHGIVRGYMRAEVGSPRAALQPLMLAHGIEAAERDGVIRFRLRDGRVDRALAADDLAEHPEAGADVEAMRAGAAEVPGRVRVAYVEAEADFEARTEEAVFPDADPAAVAASDLPMVLTRAEARGITERWLAEARVARDGLRLALPPSARAVGAGDVVSLPGRGRFRIDRVEAAGLRLVEAVRVDPAVYTPSDGAEERAAPRPFVPPLPVHPVFLDLPLIRDGQDEIAPHLAVAAVPWPGSVAVWADGPGGFALDRLVEVPATVGVTESALPGHAPGLWDRGPALRVRLSRGALASAAAAAVLAGANLAAIGDGEVWELFQFASAVPVEPGVWDLALRLRGQAGTDGVMPAVWPPGSVFVLMDGAVGQVAMAAAQRGLRRRWRIGAAARGVDDPAAVEVAAAFEGVGLRPFAPAHLRVRRDAAGDHFAWVRRSRLPEADSWSGEEVPLAEASERYRVRVRAGGAVVRSADVTAPAWTYPAALRAADGLSGDWRLEVAQVSERFGPGAWRGLDMNG